MDFRVKVSKGVSSFEVVQKIFEGLLELVETIYGMQKGHGNPTHIESGSYDMLKKMARQKLSLIENPLKIEK